jgi:PAS domain S-box-containing protein
MQKTDQDQAFRDIERYLKLAQNVAKLGIWEHDLQTDSVTISDECARLCGLPADQTEMTGEEWLSAIHPDDRNRIRALMRETLEDPRTWDAEYRVVWPDGRVHWLLAKGTVLPDDSGRPVRATGVIMDVTERKQADAVLRASEERWHAIFANSAVGIALTNRNGYFTAANAAYQALVGYSEDELRALSFLDITHDEDQPWNRALTAQLWNGEREQFTQEKRYRRKDGKVIWVRNTVSLSRGTNGAPSFAMGVVEDITERKQAEAALRESERRYKEIFDNFSECIFMVDVTPEGRFRIAGFNPAEERATGLSSAEVAGKFVDEVLDPDTARGVIGHYRQCVELGKVLNYDEELKLPRGSRYFHTNLIPVRNADGSVYRIVGCCMDFTDLKRAQEEAFARQQLESLGTLASGIAHDFNNLLGGILAQAEVAESELASGASPDDELSVIRTAALRGSEIVRQLLIYAGEDRNLVGLVDLSSLVGDMLELLKLSISKHAVIETHLSDGLPSVRANAAEIRQIVMNLITNASEAIGNTDGIIRVTTRRRVVTRESSAGVFEHCPEGEYLELEVSDSGQGISEAAQARLFDLFFTTKSSGHGLGLTIVHGIVRRLGGYIRFRANEDRERLSGCCCLGPTTASRRVLDSHPAPIASDPRRPRTACWSSTMRRICAMRS